MRGSYEDKRIDALEQKISALENLAQAAGRGVLALTTQSSQHDEKLEALARAVLGLSDELVKVAKMLDSIADAMAERSATLEVDHGEPN